MGPPFGGPISVLWDTVNTCETTDRVSGGGGGRFAAAPYRPGSPYGAMFWFRWNRLSGSQARFTSTSRS
jgi:hypothetical protein